MAIVPGNVSLGGISGIWESAEEPQEPLQIVSTLESIKAKRAFLFKVQQSERLADTDEWRYDVVLRSMIAGHTFEGPIGRAEKPISMRLQYDCRDVEDVIEKYGEASALAVLRHNGRTFYGFYSVKPEYAGLIDIYKCQSPHGLVFGDVELFGRVVEHSQGYRSEGIRIAKLSVQEPVPHGVVQALESRYQCEVEATCI